MLFYFFNVHLLNIYTSNPLEFIYYNIANLLTFTKFNFFFELKLNPSFSLSNTSGTVRFELTTFFRSARFQDECHKPDSTKYPFWQVQNFCPHGSFCPAAVSRCHVGAARYQEELNL